MKFEFASFIMGKKNAKSQATNAKADPLDHKEVFQGVLGLLKHHNDVEAKKPTTALFTDSTPINMIISVRQIPPMRVRPYIM